MLITILPTTKLSKKNMPIGPMIDRKKKNKILMDLSSYLFSFALWQIISMEKLNASANATASHIDCLVTAIMAIIRQNKLTITVNAFLSVKYFFIPNGFTQF